MSTLKLPPNAPFNGPQRMWLKGFLDGISSAFPTSITPASAPPATLTPSARPGLPVTILWGSQTGNSESLAKKLSKSLSAIGHSPSLREMAVSSAADLANLEYLLVITSTYGDGEPPDNAAALHAELALPDAAALHNLQFAVLALGDSNYPEFCKCGHDFHSRLSALGATPLLPIHEADGDCDAPFATWSAELTRCLNSLIPA